MSSLSKESIILDMQATTKEGALQELAELAVPRCKGLSVNALYRVLQERENIGSTGVGNGVAIPHGKLVGLSEILLCFGRSRLGLNFEAIDNRPVFLFMLLLSPADRASEYLRTLARVSNILKLQRNRVLLQESISKDDILDVFNDKV